MMPNHAVSVSKSVRIHWCSLLVLAVAVVGFFVSIAYLVMTKSATSVAGGISTVLDVPETPAFRPISVSRSDTLMPTVAPPGSHPNIDDDVRSRATMSEPRRPGHLHSSGSTSQGVPTEEAGASSASDNASSRQRTPFANSAAVRTYQPRVLRPMIPSSVASADNYASGDPVPHEHTTLTVLASVSNAAASPAPVTTIDDSVKSALVEVVKIVFAPLNDTLHQVLHQVQHLGDRVQKLDDRQVRSENQILEILSKVHNLDRRIMGPELSSMAAQNNAISLQMCSGKTCGCGSGSIVKMEGRHFIGTVAHNFLNKVLKCYRQTVTITFAHPALTSVERNIFDSVLVHKDVMKGVDLALMELPPNPLMQGLGLEIGLLNPHVEMNGFQLRSRAMLSGRYRSESSDVYHHESRFRSDFQGYRGYSGAGLLQNQTLVALHVGKHAPAKPEEEPEAEPEEEDLVVSGSAASLIQFANRTDVLVLDESTSDMEALDDLDENAQSMEIARLMRTTSKQCLEAVTSKRESSMAKCVKHFNDISSLNSRNPSTVSIRASFLRLEDMTTLSKFVQANGLKSCADTSVKTPTAAKPTYHDISDL